MPSFTSHNQSIRVNGVENDAKPVFFLKQVPLSHTAHPVEKRGPFFTFSQTTKMDTVVRRYERNLGDSIAQSVGST